MPSVAASCVTSKRDYPYSNTTTLCVIFACITAASGGLIFGYDLGISGGVTSMDDFLSRFFPKVYRMRHSAATNNYCKFDNQMLTLFTSSLYLAAFITSFFASTMTKHHGRRASILTGGVCFLVGSTVNGFAENLAMLIIGRIMLGVGIGFTNQAVPLYLSEISPANLRGALTTFFQIAIVIGALIAALVNYGAGFIVPWGWRLSLGLAFVPSAVMTIGAIFLPDTPCSLIERGRLEQCRAVLAKMRGTPDVQAEFEDLVESVELCKAVKHPWRNILSRKYRPQLVMAFAIPFFQQFAGINIIVFYAPVLFQTLGFGANAALFSSVIVGTAALAISIVAALVMDKVGRRKLFLSGGSLMVFFLILTGLLLQWKLGAYTTPSKGYGILGVLLICLYVVTFGWSWGPLGWVVPSEIFPLEIRPAGQSISLSVIMFCTFLTAQSFLAMLCSLKAGLFFFFAAWGIIMTLFIYKLFPETKCVPLEEIADLWKHHPFWSRFYE